MTYDVGAFNSNFMFEREDHKSKVAYADGSVKLDPTNYYTLGASYDFGDFTLYGAYQYVSHGTRMPGYNYIHIDKKTGASTTVAEPATKGVNQNAASVSIAAPLWGGTAMLQLNGVKEKSTTPGLSVPVTPIRSPREHWFTVLSTMVTATKRSVNPALTATAVSSAWLPPSSHTSQTAAAGCGQQT